MKAFVAGATGETGRRIVQELVNRDIPVRALTRNLEKGQTVLPASVELVVGNVLTPETLPEAIGDSTVVLSATGASPSLNPTGPYLVDYEGTKNLIDVAKAKDIEHFVMVSSLCTSKFFHPLNLFWLVLYWKKQAEEYLQNSGLTYTIVRPGGLRNEEKDDAIVMESADSLFEGNISRTKVAKTCVESLNHPEAKNRILEVIAKSEAKEKDWNELFASVV
jgi:uncharacterized protein YbjT (DUF2867 family)